MAGKLTGLGWTTLSLDDGAASLQDIKNDVTNFNFAMPRGVQDVTGVDKSAYERLLLLADFSAARALPRRPHGLRRGRTTSAPRVASPPPPPQNPPPPRPRRRVGCPTALNT